jgi:Kef-type K+ transport system membrane component KefB
MPSLAKFALAMALIVVIPPLCRRARLPAVVGLLLSGVVLGPHVLGIARERTPIADFFAELGKLLLMFFAGLEIDLAQFRRAQNKSLAAASLLAQSINLPEIVGAFLAGLAVNAAVKNKPAKEKLEFFGNSFFIPIFFAATGFLIDPVASFQVITTNFPLASAVIAALLVGKWMAAEIVGRAFA